MKREQVSLHSMVAGVVCALLTACGSQQTSVTGAPRNETAAKPKAGEAELKRGMTASLDAKKFTQIRVWSLGVSAIDKFSRRKFLRQRLVAMRRSDRAVLIINIQIAASASEADQYVEESDKSRAAAFKKNSAGVPLIGEEVWRYSYGIGARGTNAIVLARQGRAIVDVTLRTGARKDSSGHWVKDKSGKPATKPLSATDLKFVDMQAMATLRQLQQAGFTE